MYAESENNVTAASVISSETVDRLWELADC